MLSEPEEDLETQEYQLASVDSQCSNDRRAAWCCGAESESAYLVVAGKVSVRACCSC